MTEELRCVHMLNQVMCWGWVDVLSVFCSCADVGLPVRRSQTSSLTVERDAQVEDHKALEEVCTTLLRNLLWVPLESSNTAPLICWPFNAPPPSFSSQRILELQRQASQKADTVNQLRAEIEFCVRILSLHMLCTLSSRSWSLPTDSGKNISWVPLLSRSLTRSAARDRATLQAKEKQFQKELSKAAEERDALKFVLRVSALQILHTHLSFFLNRSLSRQRTAGRITGGPSSVRTGLPHSACLFVDYTSSVSLNRQSAPVQDLVSQLEVVKADSATREQELQHQVEAERARSEVLEQDLKVLSKEWKYFRKGESSCWYIHDCVAMYFSLLHGIHLSIEAWGRAHSSGGGAREQEE